MFGVIIEIEAVNDLIDNYRLPVSPKDLKAQLSMCLTETEADLFNAEKFEQIRLINDMVDIYDETGEFIEPEVLLNGVY